MGETKEATMSDERGGEVIKGTLEMIVLEDCCAAATAQEHENSIGSISRFCKVAKSTDAGVFET